jgi:hypothetical protein
MLHCSHYGNVYGRSLKRLTVVLPYDSVMSLPGINPSKSKYVYNKGICVLMFSVALFIIAVP